MSLSTANKLIIAFVTLLIGVILVGSVASEGLNKTTKTVISDEAISIAPAKLAADNINTTYEFTVANNPTSWKIQDCPLTSVTYGNSTTDYTVTTDYVITASSGVLTLKNTSTVYEGGNDTVIDYTYCGDEYMNLAWGRTGINLVSGLFAIAILLISVGLFYSVAKDTGML